jgi:hypothetical protein
MANTQIQSEQIAPNLDFTGSEGVTLPSGTTAERPSSPATGVFRFNTTTEVMEYYNGNNWQGVVQEAPAVTSISPTTEIDANAEIVITGTGFNSGATVKFIGNDGTEYNSPSVIFNSTTQLTATTPSSALTVANEPYDVKVINASGFSGVLENALDAGSTPSFGVAAGSLGTLVEGENASGFTQITATDADGQSVSITLKSGSSLPSGVSMSTSGVFSGTTPTTGSNVTTTFTVEATDGVNVSERTYSVTVRTPIYAQLSGSGTWSVPAGVNSAEILIVGGGASGAKSQNVGSGGGGAGGVVHASTYTFTSTDKSSGIAYSVGNGGDGVGSSPYAFDGGFNNGEDTTFAISGGTITAKGGGGGGGYGGTPGPWYGGNSVTPAFSQSYFAAHTGGSGGGGAWVDLNGASSNQGTFSGWTSYGNSGGSFNTAGSGGYSGAGGGGAGAAGNDSTRNVAGAGGAGQLFSNFTAYGESGYFGGGGGGGQVGGTRAAGGIGGGGQGGNGSGGLYFYSGEDATDGTGGGGGAAGMTGGYGDYSNKGGDGGNGTILIRY